MSDELSVTDRVATVLIDLRRRLLYCALAVAVGSTVGLIYSKDLIEVLKAPFHAVMGPHNRLYFTAPAESLVAHMVVGIVAGVILAAPYLFLHLWWLAAPRLYRQRRVQFLTFSMVTAVAFVAGALFGYFGVLPAAIDLLVRGFEARRMFEAYIKISAFTGFALKLMAAFGLAFELPVVMFILGRLGVINRRQVWSGARYALVLIFLAAAVLTPPDVATQFVLAVPLFALYVLGAVAVTLFGKREAPARPDETANGEAESTGGASTESREDAPQ